MAVNEVAVQGNLTHDPEVSYNNAGKEVCRMRFAHNRRWKTRDAEWKEEVSYFEAEAWGYWAKIAAALSKGDPVLVHGRLQQDRWEKEDGQKNSKVKIVVENLLVLVRRPKEETNSEDL